MSTTQEREQERAHALTMLRKIISRDTIIHTRTDFGRGETDHVRVYVIRWPVAGEPPQIEDVSYYVGRAAGRRITDRGIAYGGAQYSKGLEAADDAWRAAFGEAIPQTERWRELH